MAFSIAAYWACSSQPVEIVLTILMPGYLAMLARAVLPVLGPGGRGLAGDDEDLALGPHVLLEDVPGDLARLDEVLTEEAEPLGARGLAVEGDDGYAGGHGLVDDRIEGFAVDVRDRESGYLFRDRVLHEGDFLVDLYADGADEFHFDSELFAGGESARLDDLPEFDTRVVIHDRDGDVLRGGRGEDRAAEGGENERESKALVLHVRLLYNFRRLGRLRRQVKTPFPSVIRQYHQRAYLITCSLVLSSPESWATREPFFMIRMRSLSDTTSASSDETIRIESPASRSLLRIL